MNLFGFDPHDFLSFFLTMFRISIVLFLLPFFGGKSAPTLVKAALVLILTLAVWPQLSFPADMMPAEPLAIVLMILGELTLGLIMGLMVNFLFAAVQTGGHILGFQMGFAMVTVVDPISGVSEAVTAHFLYMCTMLTFLALNGPLYLLQGVGQSFALVPPGGLFITPELAHNVFAFSEQMFTLAIKIAAPVMAALFLVDLSLALISRAAPQIQVLLLGFPIKISVGFLFMGMLFTLLTIYATDFLAGLPAMFNNLFRSMRP